MHSSPEAGSCPHNPVLSGLSHKKRKKNPRRWRGSISCQIQVVLLRSLSYTAARFCALQNRDLCARKGRSACYGSLFCGIMNASVAWRLPCESASPSTFHVCMEVVLHADAMLFLTISLAQRFFKCNPQFFTHFSPDLFSYYTPVFPTFYPYSEKCRAFGSTSRIRRGFTYGVGVQSFFSARRCFIEMIRIIGWAGS